MYPQIKGRSDAKFSLSASYLEIYNEAVYDLLTSRHAGGVGSLGAQGGAVGAMTSTLMPAGASNTPQLTRGGTTTAARATNTDLPIKWDAALGFHVPGLKVVQCSHVERMIEVQAAAWSGASCN